MSTVWIPHSQRVGGKRRSSYARLQKCGSWFSAAQPRNWETGVEEIQFIWKRSRRSPCQFKGTYLLLTANGSLETGKKKKHLTGAKWNTWSESPEVRIEFRTFFPCGQCSKHCTTNCKLMLTWFLNYILNILMLIHWNQWTLLLGVQCD